MAGDIVVIDAAIALYHRLLDESPDLARQSQQMLDEGMQAEGLFFGSRPVCTLLRPHLISAEQFAQVAEASRLVSAAMRRLGEAMLRDPALMEKLGLGESERRLVAVDPGYTAISAISRLDGFLTPAGLHFVECNGEPPAGGAYTDELAIIFRRLPVVQRFLADGGYAARTFDSRQSLLALILACYHSWGGRDTPSAAIVDWAGLPTASEFELCRRYFEAHGLPTIIVDPRDLDYRDGRLRHGDTAINLIYKRVLVHELLRREDEVRPLLQAYEDGRVCLVNAPRAKLFHKKALFALLGDEEFDVGFVPAERAAIRRHIPWTRRVEEGFTSYRGARVDLLDLVRRERDRFILKPNDEYGGKGITAGWVGDDAAWDAALADALAGDYVVQERVPIARASFPHMVDGQVRYRDLFVDLDPFIVGGEADSLMTRVADTTLLNVSGGGSFLPAFVLSS
ncbi:MAG: hypothetical protein JOZ41_18585 [Chloroflexi bacterium]|nr:hypothetical protein [Chloroflexota bacterium]